MTEWSLHDKKTGKKISPLRYSNGKTQEKVVEEILDALKHDRIVLFRGGVGTGKSVVALHIVREYGFGNIVVPTKVLEKQYYEDYTNRFYINGLNIKYFMGKNNYRCKFFNKSVPCGHRMCPCSCPLDKGQKRLDVAKQCPHYSPVVSKKISKKVVEILRDEHGHDYEINYYNSFRGSEAHILSPIPCEYYSTFNVYTDKRPHATVFNLAKWEIESWIGRKAVVPVEIIDEGDLFLDELTYKVSISENTIESIKNEGLVPKENVMEFERKFREIISIVRSYYNVLGYNDYIIELLNTFLDTMQGVSTSGRVCQMVERVRLILRYQYESWCVVKKRRVTVYIPRPDITLKNLMKRCGKLVLMSATFQPQDVLREIYGIDPPIIEGETRFPGLLKLRVTGKEVYVNNRNWESHEFKNRYWRLLNKMIDRSSKPTLVQVHAYRYVPDGIDVNKENPDVWWSTVSDRGLDLRDDKCRSIVVLKYPYPDLNDPVLKTMERVLKGKFWKYYEDKARRELIQQIGRGLRSKHDWVEVWSPDRRVTRTVPKIWRGQLQVERVKID